jgi:hypothetical protein
MEENKFQEAIDNHKKQGIETYTITCKNGMQCLIKDISIDFLEVLLTELYSQKRNVVAIGRKILEECWISGDDEIRKNKKLKLEASLGAYQIIEFEVADVKKN